MTTQSLVVSVSHIPPQDHSFCSQFGFFSVVSKMFEDHVSFTIHCFDMIIHSFEQCDPGIIFGRPGPYITRIIRLCEAFRKVEAITIKMVFIDPISIHRIHKVLRVGTLMIEVETHVKRMGRISVKPRTIRTWLIYCWVPIHPYHWIESKSMIQNHI